MPKQRNQLGKSNLGRDVNRIIVAVNKAPTIVTGADHSTLTGLDGDDHPQYFNLNQDETVLGQPTLNPGTAKPPLILHANGQNQTVIGLRADSLNKSVLAGSGLVTGGVLTSDVTLDVGAGDGINVLTNSIEVDVTDLIGAGLVEIATNNIGLADSVAGPGLTIDGSKIISVNPGTALEISGDAIIHSTGDNGDLHPNYPEIDQVETITGAWKWSIDLIPNLPDTYDIGSSIKLWKTIWASEIEAILFVTNAVRVEMGWLVIAHDGGTLPVDINASQTTIDFGKAMTTGDFIVFRGNLKVEYISVDSLSSGTTYNVSRGLEAAGVGDIWPAGQVYLVLGQSGNGRIELTSDNSDSPKISFISQGATYNAQLEYARIGNLRSSYGIGPTDTFGVGLGRFETGYNYISITAADGLQFYDTADTVIGSLTGLIWTLGKTSAEHVIISSSGVTLKDSGTTMGSFTAASVTIGQVAEAHTAITPTSISMKDASGNSIIFITGSDAIFGRVDTNFGNMRWNNASKILEFRGGVSGTDVMAYISTDGSITASGGDLTINDEGINIAIPSGYAFAQSINWLDGSGNERATLAADGTSVATYLNLFSDSRDTASQKSTIRVTSYAPSGTQSRVEIKAAEATSAVQLTLQVDGGTNDVWAALSGLTGVSEYFRGLVIGSASEPAILGNNGLLTVLGDAYIEDVLFINETAYSGTYLTAGLVINQGAADNEALALCSSDVTHGITANTDTNSFFTIKKQDASTGGASVIGWGESASTIGMSLKGISGTSDGFKNDSADAAVQIQGMKKNGTGVGGHVATANVLIVSSYTKNLVIIDEEGELHVNASREITGLDTHNHYGHVFAWDDFDDVALLNGFRASQSPIGHQLREDFGEFIDYARPILEGTGIVTYNDGAGGDGSVWYGMRGMQMLTIDAVRQLYSKMERYEKALLSAGVDPKLLESG